MKQPIELTRQYTCNGKRVINLRYVPYNSAGGKVTYPIKGSVVVRERPLKLQYRVWSLYGEDNVVFQNQAYNLTPAED